MPLEAGLTQAARAADRVARASYGKLVAFLSARTRDVAAAEDALSEAFAAALRHWPSDGVPEKPEAWLMTVARRKLIDARRRAVAAEAAQQPLALIAEELEALAGEPDAIPDDRLALIFACAHPAVDPDIRAPLILQTILGLDAAAIASAFLVSPAAMGQRLARAKARIKQAGIPLRRPDRAELPERLDGVLEAIYAAFTEGWSDPAGVEPRRRNLAAEALWLGRLLASLAPEEPEALGLLALMLYAEARRAARRDAAGAFVPLDGQDPTHWDSAMIEEAERHLFRAAAMRRFGRYQLEAAIQSAHIVRRSAGHSDWDAIVALYDQLLALTGSPVAAINRAIAISQTRGAAEGLVALPAQDDARLAQYQPYWAARADLLAQLGEAASAQDAYSRAIGLESDPAVRRFLQAKAAEAGAAPKRHIVERTSG